MTSRSLRTLPSFGRRRGMLDAAIRRRSITGVDEAPEDETARVPGPQQVPTRRPEIRADQSRDDVS